MKLSVWAKKNGLSYQTAWQLFKDGNLPVGAIQLKTGTILVNDSESTNVTATGVDGETVVYARVSNQSRKKEIKLQSDRCSEFCRANGWAVSRVYEEIASGMNDSRKVLWKMIEKRPARIVVENKGRFTRFGFVYLEKLLLTQGCEIVIINKAQTDEGDLINDLASVIYSFCARLYGMRRARNKVNQYKKIMESE